MAWRFVVEVIAVLLMVGGVGGILYGVLKGTLAFSARTLQFMTIACVLPAVLVLSLERAIGNEATAGLLGTVLGYVLSGMAKAE